MIDTKLYQEIYSNHNKNCMGFDTLLLKPSASGRFLAIWGKDRSKPLPGFLRTHDLDLGHPDVPKYVRTVDFYGEGECHVRVLVDGTVRAAGKVVLSDHYTPARQIGLPRGTCGRRVCIEILGHVQPRFFEIDWDLVGGQ